MAKRPQPLPPNQGAAGKAGPTAATRPDVKPADPEQAAAPLTPSAGDETPAEPANQPSTNGLIEQQADESPPAATNQPTPDATSTPQPEADRPGEGEAPVFIQGSEHPRFQSFAIEAFPRLLTTDDEVRYDTPHLTDRKALTGEAQFHLPPPP